MLLAAASLLAACRSGVDGRYMLFPIDESADEITMSIDKGGEEVYVVDIRLALGDKVDYCVPLDMEHFGAKKKNVRFSGIDAKTAWSRIVSPTPARKSLWTSIVPFIIIRLNTAG